MQFSNIIRALFGVTVLMLASSAYAERTVLSSIDDTGQKIVLSTAAQRIVSLAPHITEWLYDIGAGNQLIATVEFSDYPIEAKSLPRIGNSNRIDQEKVLSLEPDLVVAWKSGTPDHTLKRLRQLGIPVYISEPKNLDDIFRNMIALGTLSGHPETAKKRVQQAQLTQDKLTSRFSHKPHVSLFYEVWQKPLMTIGGTHYINELISMCAGHNIFSDLQQLAPSVGLEAVMAARPEVIVTTSDQTDHKHFWQTYDTIPAVKYNRFIQINPDLMSRPTTRILQGAQYLCEQLDRFRSDLAR